MGYSTDYDGAITITPPLSAAEVAYLTAFSECRHMDRDQGPYYVDGGQYGDAGHDGVRAGSTPPAGQPSLWCDFAPTPDGTALIWNGSEKTYEGAAWVEYLIKHFIGSTPVARQREPERFAFLQGHDCNGTLNAQGEEHADHWQLVVEHNRVHVRA